MADKSAYVPPEALSGSGGLKRDSSDVDLDDIDFFAKPAAKQEKKPITPPTVVVPTPPSPCKPHSEPPKKPVIVYKKASTYQKTFAGPRK